MSIDKVQLSFKWPELPDNSFKEEFFLGAWHPFANLQVSNPSQPTSIDVSSISGRNWVILSSRSPFQTNANGLAHVPSRRPCISYEQIPDAIAFRGYVLEPPIHSWSQPEGIVEYWSQNHTRHNGVFASIVIGHGGEEIKLTCDAFGISTLYYREFAGGVLFSTNTRFLTTANDQLDLISARILMHCGSVYGNGSLTEGVLRVPPGTTMSFRNGTMIKRKWFDYANLSTGNKPVTLSGLREVEDAFQNSIERCLRLQASGHVLPLSSGYDSRRILSALHSRSVPFEALTVRVLQKEYRDLDGHWASEMSRDLGFKHEVVNLPSPSEFARLDRLRRILVDAHGTEHTWFLSLYPYISNKSCLIFDGLGGDVFGNTGFGVEELHTVEDSIKIQMILDELITDKLDGILSERLWPSTNSVCQTLEAFLDVLPDGRNKSDLAFLWMRCRSGPGMCFQRLIPAGHVTVYPYFDLDYVHIALSFNPLDKLPPRTLQDRCLAEFWPRYYAFPGSRRIPTESKPGNPMSYEALKQACFNQMNAELGLSGRLTLKNIITTRAFVMTCLSILNKSAHRRVSWWLDMLFMLMAQQMNNKICWDIDKLKTLTTALRK